jgi:hypothetical protein
MIEPKLRELLQSLDVKVVTRTPENWLLCHCPFPRRHKGGSDRNPSFAVSIRNNGLSGYNCWSCKSKGNIGKLIRELEKERDESYQRLYMRAVMDEVPSDFGPFDVEVDELEEEPQPLNAAQFVGMFLPAWEDRAARKYLIKRGISERTVRRLGIVFDEDEQRILFPVYGDSEEELFGFTGRTILPEDKWPESQGKSRYRKVKDYAGLKKRHRILGQHLWKPKLPTFVEEGLMGYAHLHEIGAAKVCNIGALMGSTLYTHQRDIIVDQDEPAYLCLDDDLAGDIGLYGPMSGDDHAGGGAIDMLRDRLPTYLVQYPKGVDDVDNFNLQHVVDALRDRTTRC